MDNNRIGLDIAKNVFHFFGVNQSTGEITKKVVKRKDLLAYTSTISASEIGIEACSGSHYLARELTKQGHRVKLIAPQFVKPYVIGNKNDMIDARAIYEALSRPEMKCVPIKTVSQQDQQMIHRIRSRLIANRTALGNSIRAFLHEYGILLARGHSQIRKKLPEVLESHSFKLSEIAILHLKELREEFLTIDKKIAFYDQQLADYLQRDKGAERLSSIPGIGVVGATALSSAVGDGSCFENGRQLSAWLGLVPSQHSSGGKTVLGGITKRGDNYLRQLLVHGARSLLQSARMRKESDRTSLERWAVTKSETAGYNKATVALANKLARISWALLRREEYYRVRVTQG